MDSYRITNPADIQDSHLDSKLGGWCEGNCSEVQNGRHGNLYGTAITP